MAVLIVLALFVAYLVLNTVLFTRNGRKETDPDAGSDYVVDEQLQKEVNDHLIGAIHIETVSHNDPSLTDWSKFLEMHEYLKKTYPGVFSTMELEVVEKYSLMLRWKGTEEGRNPIAFLGHLDVVPVEPVSEWTYPPFSGTIADGYIWGRGTLDMRCQFITVLESCERLIKEGFTPKQDVYLLFGCNEEVGDQPAGIGADRLSAILEERGIRLDCVIDEGGAITDGEALGIDKKVCAVGVSEKGFVSFDIYAEDEGGHSSRPPKHTALGMVCAAAQKIENNWMKPVLNPAVEKMLTIAAPYMKSFGARFLLANKAVFRPIIPKVLSGISSIKPFVQSTTALTMASGSPQDNVLPQEAHIIMNSRLIPGDTVESVKRHLEALCEGTGAKVKIYKGGSEASPVSPSDTVAFSTLEDLVEEYYPGTVMVPYIQLGASDSKNYYNVCDNVYRIMPFYFPYWVTNMGHRADERIPVEALEKGVRLFMDFIREYKGE